MEVYWNLKQLQLVKSGKHSLLYLHLLQKINVGFPNSFDKNLLN